MANSLVLIALSLLLAGGFGASLVAFSGFDMGWVDLRQWLLGQEGNALHQQIIQSLRLPRAILAMIVGAALALAGLLLQSLTRNPIASPSVFGISHGAALAFTLSATGMVPFVSAMPVLLVTFLGAAMAGVLVFFLAGLHQANPNTVRIVLAGIALNFLFVSLTRALVIFADENAYGVFHWLNGSLANASFKDVQLMLPLFVVSLLLCLYLAFQLDLLALGDQMMQSLGGNLMVTRALCALALLGLIGGAVTVAGPISFIGLMVPHLARSLLGAKHLWLMPGCVLMGANLLLFCDLAMRGLHPDQEQPVGIMISLLGALFLLVLVRRTLVQSKGSVGA